MSLFCLFLGLYVWNGSVQVPWLDYCALSLEVLGLGSFVRIWARRRVGFGIQSLLMLGLFLGVLARAYMLVLANPAYGTDEIAFDQYAARVLIHGHNPYTASMAPALQAFRVPHIYYTFTLSGHPVTALSYPAMAFLPYVPLLATGLQTQVATIVDLAAWLLTGLLMWRLLPEPARWAGGVIVGAGLYFSFAVGGVTDVLYLPPLLIAVWKWDQFGNPNCRGWARWIGPIALGVAAAVKQTPWFVLPFLLVGIAMESRSRGGHWKRTVFRYAGVAVMVFAILNAPFIVVNPGAWAHGVLTPLLSPTVPGGQGLVSLTMLNGMGGLLQLYTLAGGLAYLLGLTSLALFYPQLKRAWVPMVALVFFFPTRSFASYLIELLPVAIVAATTARHQSPAGLLPRARWVLAPALAATLFLVAAGAVISRPPLRLAILREGSTGQLQTVDQLTVLVRNTSNHAITPHFSIDATGQESSFWYPSPGTGAVVPAHTSRIMTLEAPDVASMPRMNGGFVLAAFVTDPPAMATTRVAPSGESLYIQPDGVEAPVRSGTVTLFRVQLLGRLGLPIRRAGVRVELGQVIYAGGGLLPAEAAINGHLEGQTPVAARTDGRGVAIFRVRGAQAQSQPVFFQAWILTSRGLPTGYSNQVAIHFIK